MVLIQGTNIAVDNFKYSTEPGQPQYVYFLTHMHTDHYQGLTDNWDQGLIYCSPVTKSLLLLKYPHLTCVISLELNTVHWVSLNSDHSEGVSVSFIDANHCPGAVMILFKGKMGTILHTGDFRYSREMAENELLRDAKGEKLRIDLMYLDNTYLGKQFVFPPQASVLSHLLSLLDSHPNTEFEVGLDTFGKEEVLTCIAQHLNTKVLVSPEKYRELEVTGTDMDLFTVQEELAMVRQVPKSALKMIPEKIREGRKVVGFKLSGWTPFSQLTPWLYTLPYSLHSNYPELIECMEAFQPCNIVFTVDKSARGQDAEEFLRKYSYKRPLQGKTEGAKVVTGTLKRKIPMESQCQVGKKRKVLGSRICS